MKCYLERKSYKKTKIQVLSQFRKIIYKSVKNTRLSLYSVFTSNGKPNNFLEKPTTKQTEKGGPTAKCNQENCKLFPYS